MKVSKLQGLLPLITCNGFHVTRAHFGCYLPLFILMFCVI